MRAIFAAVCFVPLLASGGTIAEKGTEPGYWNTHSVVYGIIEKGEKLSTSPTQSPRKYRLTFRPQVTLTGKFDCAFHHKIYPTYESADFGGVLSDPVNYGDKVILVLNQDSTGWTIPFQGVVYIPKSIPILPVTGLDDPLVNETIELLKKHRRLNRKFSIEVYVTLKEAGKTRKITREQIEERIKTRLVESNDILLSEIFKLPFSADDSTPLGDLATIDIRLRALASSKHSGE